MTIPSFADRARQWSSPPVDDVGYMEAAKLLAMTNRELGGLIRKAERNRYSGWRNWQGRWDAILIGDGLADLSVLDYGCGIGVESLRYAERGARVFPADITPLNVELAVRVLSLHGYTAGAVGEDDSFLIRAQPPFLTIPSESFHIVHCAGVLHHIPQPKPVVKQMAKWLRPGGQLRLMLYSDKAWRVAVGTEPPSGPVEKDPGFLRFVNHWDAVGGYADWYDLARVEERFGDWFDVIRYEPLTEGGEYVGAVLVKR